MFDQFIGVKPVEERHRFDVARLEQFLRGKIEDWSGPLTVEQFKGGQSNPTYRITAGARRYALRRKPPGKLLPSAHAVDREYKVIKALHAVGFPVAKPWVLCEDDSVIGTAFYVMEHVEGRIFRNPTLPALQPSERAAIYDAMNDVLARLHEVDPVAVGLADYGKPGNYFARQIGRWTKQYELSKGSGTSIPSMDALIAWLPAHAPQDDETTLVHGDFRLENMIFHPNEPRVLAVLDWELSTLGHPLADLAYNCIGYHTVSTEGTSLQGLDPASGIPSEADYLAAYCRRTGRARIEHWSFCIAFSLFRLAAIAQGIAMRAAQGNAASAAAANVGAAARGLADRAWEIAQRGD
jgi:aminoglycoside phosphotransferase (APT) family kinase protein